MTMNDYSPETQPRIHEKQGLIYAGFWIRLYAKILDWIICAIILSILPVPPLNDGSVIMVSNQLYISLIEVLRWCIPAIYTVIFLVHYQATPGKMAFSLQVVSAHGQQLTYGMALARFFCELISMFLFFMGYMIAIIDPQKRTLHDRICGTFVVKSTRVVYTNEPVNMTVDYDHVQAETEHYHQRTINNLHTLVFSLLIIESLFSIAICLTNDTFFQVIKWCLTISISTLLFFALMKQKNSDISVSIKRLTWIITIYYCVLTPLIYMASFLIGIEQFLHELPLNMDDPVLYFMQILLAIMNMMTLSEWPQLMVTIIFIPCSFVLGFIGIIMISSNNPITNHSPE